MREREKLCQSYGMTASCPKVASPSSVNTRRIKSSASCSPSIDMVNEINLDSAIKYSAIMPFRACPDNTITNNYRHGCAPFQHDPDNQKLYVPRPLASSGKAATCGLSYFLSIVILLSLSLWSHPTQRFCCAYPCMLRGSSLGSSSIFLTIPESFRARHVFTTLSQIEGDPNPLNGTIQLSLRHPNEYFAFNGPRKELTLKKPLDREKMGGNNRIELDIVCHYLDTSVVPQWQEVVLPVQIVVQDVNDNAPVFLGTPYSTNISEFTQPGTIIFNHVKAIDYDATSNTVTYSIVYDRALLPSRMFFRDAQHFSIADPISGAVVLDKPLDYEVQNVAYVVIQARDQGSDPSLTSTTTLTVHVLDADDQNPTFPYEQYTSVLPRGAKSGFELDVEPQPISAHDMDSGIQALVVYSLQDGGSQKFFHINSTSGRLYLANPIPHSGIYFLTVRATQVDNPDRFSTTTLVVRAEMPNYSPPQFTNHSYNIQLPETFPLGVDVLHVSAVTSDGPKDNNTAPSQAALPPTLTYGLKNDFGGTFSIDPKNGVIQLRKHLDYEQSHMYELMATVTDDGQLNDTTTIHIDVMDVNDNDPEFSRPSYDFKPVSREPGSFVGRVQVHDNDPNDQVHLSLSSFNDLFTVDDSGQIRIRRPQSPYITGSEGDESTAKKATSLNETEYRLTVVAEDTGHPPRRNFVPVTIHFPPLEMASNATKAKNLIGTGGEYLILAIILGSAAAFLLMLVICLICYVGRVQTSGIKYYQQQQTYTTQNSRPWRCKYSSSADSSFGSPDSFNRPASSSQWGRAGPSETIITTSIHPTATLSAAALRIARGSTASYGVSNDNIVNGSRRKTDNKQIFQRLPFEHQFQLPAPVPPPRHDDLALSSSANTTTSGGSGNGSPVTSETDDVMVIVAATAAAAAATSEENQHIGPPQDSRSVGEQRNGDTHTNISTIARWRATSRSSSRKSQLPKSTTNILPSPSSSSASPSPVVNNHRITSTNSIAQPLSNNSVFDEGQRTAIERMTLSAADETQADVAGGVTTTSGTKRFKKKLKWEDQQNGKMRHPLPHAMTTSDQIQAVNHTKQRSSPTPIRFTPPYTIAPLSSNNLYYHHPLRSSFDSTVPTTRQALVTSPNTGAADIISAWGPEVPPSMSSTVIRSGNLVTYFELSRLEQHQLEEAEHDGPNGGQNDNQSQSYYQNQQQEKNEDASCDGNRNQSLSADIIGFGPTRRRPAQLRPEDQQQSRYPSRYPSSHLTSISSAYSSLERPADRTELTVYF